MKLLKLLCAALALIAGSACADTSLLLYGTSYHFNGALKPTAYHYNQANYGLGIEYSDAGWLVGAGTYLDSYNEQGYMLYGGYRWVFGNPREWHTSVAIKAGYLNGSGFHGPVALPVLGVGYNHVNLELSGAPAAGHGKDSVLMMWLRYQF